MKIQLEHSAHNLDITENESGLVVTLENLEGLKVAEIAYSNYSNSIIHVLNYTKLEELYQCEECESTFTEEEAGSFCGECGAEGLSLIEDRDEG